MIGIHFPLLFYGYGFLFFSEAPEDFALCALNLQLQLQNGSDHIVVASYSELYEEGDIEHINVFGLVY